MLKNKSDNHLYENIISKRKSNDSNITVNKKKNNPNDNNNEKIINLIKC